MVTSSPDTPPWPVDPGVDEEGFARERAETNLRRLLFLGLVALVLHVVNVAVFHRPGDWAGSTAVAEWRRTLTVSHGVMGVLAGALALSAWRVMTRRPLAPGPATVLTLGAALAYGLFGAWVSAVDQLVIQSVTPFLSISLMVALGLRLGAGPATALYAVLLVAGVVLQFRSAAPDAVRVSNAVNMVSISVLSWILSRLMETARHREFVQRATIEHQGAALAAAANGVMVTRRDGAISWVNPGFTRVTGYPAQEAVGRTPRILRSGLHDAAFYGGLWGALLRGDVWHGESVNRRKDGTLYTQEQTIAPLRDRAGSITHFVSVFQDVSDRKRVEQTQRDLTHTMVHDMRNPMTSVSLALDVVADSPGLSPAIAATVALARRNADRTLSLVSSILDISRLEEGQMPIERTNVRLDAMVTRVLELQAPLATHKRLTLCAEVPPTLPPVYTDAGLLERVLQNLVDNAAKFTPSGGRVVVRAETEPEQMLVSVEDDGPGLSEAARGRLFHRFATGNTPGRGSGLGLAFCRLAVEALGGRIWAAPASEHGATLRFTLPLAPLSSPSGVSV